jgi:hypothetical protein
MKIEAIYYETPDGTYAIKEFEDGVKSIELNSTLIPNKTVFVVTKYEYDMTSMIPYEKVFCIIYKQEEK